MLNITLDIAEDVIHVKAAKTLCELPLKNYIRFIKSVYPLVSADLGDEGAASDVPHAHVVVNAVEAFLGLDSGTMHKVHRIAQDHELGSINSLFAHAVRVCTQRFFDIESQYVTFKYKEEEFEYPFNKARILANFSSEKTEQLTVAEFVEASEIVRIASQKVNDDPDGSALYSYYLHLIAVLCRKPGEQLPVDHEEMQQFIAQRASFFADIDAHTALIVDFFLEISLSNLLREQTAFSSLTKYHLLLQLATQPQLLRQRRQDLKYKRKPRLHLSALAGGSSTSN